MSDIFAITISSATFAGKRGMPGNRRKRSDKECMNKDESVGASVKYINIWSSN